MTETSYFWPGDSTGDASLAPYSDEHYATIMDILFRHEFSTGYETRAATVFRNYSEELEVSQLTDSSLILKPGLAIIDGTFYENTSSITFYPAPEADHPYYGLSVFRVIGLRKDFAAHTVRAFMGPMYLSAADAILNLQRIDGIVREDVLATMQVYTDGTITSLSDYRSFSSAPLGLGIIYRIGSSIYNWGSSGSANLLPISPSRQTGVGRFSLASGDTSDTVAVTFPDPFPHYNGFESIPMIFLTPIQFTPAQKPTNFECYMYPANVDKDGFDAIFERTTTGTAEDLSFLWIAIGDR